MFLVHVYIYQAEINWKPEGNRADAKMSMKQSSRGKKLKLSSKWNFIFDVCKINRSDSFKQYE